mmetsp:Transcript_27951/g.43333  ORF Transcript_27951/g.43333 Transcript_27951/m.43333 type:complete len:405 (-) Transcript_27951:37-1251(-)
MQETTNAIYQSMSQSTTAGLDENFETTSPLRSVHRFYQIALKKWKQYPTLPNGYAEAFESAGKENISDEPHKNAPHRNNLSCASRKPSVEPTPSPRGSSQWEIVSREGIPEVLCDSGTASITFREYGNIANFFLFTVPRLLSRGDFHSSSMPLSQLWKFYDDMSGIEVPLCSPNETLLQTLYYMPLLSTLNIRIAKTCKVLHFSEDRPPLERPPLYHHISQLVMEDEIFSPLNSLFLGEIDPSSYYSVLWVPIHCQAHSPQRSAGAFLTYHTFSPTKLSRHFPVANRDSMVNEMTITDHHDSLCVSTSIHEEQEFYFCNCIGFIPFRARADIWYCGMQKSTYRAPLQLLIAAFHLVQVSPLSQKVDHDMIFYLNHDKSMADFLWKSLCHQYKKKESSLPPAHSV